VAEGTSLVALGTSYLRLALAAALKAWGGVFGGTFCGQTWKLISGRGSRRPGAVISASRASSTKRKTPCGNLAI